VKAISLWQPHATWIAMKWKTIETRTHARFARLKGHRIAIHAAQKQDHSFGIMPFWKSPQVGVYLMNLEIWIDRCRGHIVCTALVEKALWTPNVDFIEREEWEHKACCDIRDKYLLVLEDIKPLEKPIPFRGKQGIFNVPDELVPLDGRGQ